MTKKLTGLYPLAYVGVNADKPPNLVMYERDPLATDYKNFNIGSIWIYPSANRIYMLTNKTGGVSTWLQLSTSGGGDDVQNIKTDDGLVTIPDATGTVTISGSLNIDTSQVGPNEIQIELDDDVNISGDFDAGGFIEGGTGLKINSLNTAGVVQTSALGAFSTSNGVNGEVLIGGGATPVWSTITAGAGVTVTNAAGSITIAATSAGNDLIEGSIIKYDGAIPGGASWLPCDGSSVSQATYPTLFARIGHEYLIPTFTLQTTGFTGTINCVHHNGLAGADGLWVAGGTNGELYSSPDGVVWTSRTSTFGTDTIYGVSHTGLSGSDALWVITGSKAKLATSTDGITWTARTSNFSPSYSIYDVAHNGLTGGSSLWVAVGTGTEYATSPDGITWTKTNTGTGLEDLTAITYNNGVWIVTEGVGSISSIIYSASGTSWGSVYDQRYFRTLNTPGFKDVASSGSLFMAISNGTQTNNQVLTSTDGSNWKELTTQPFGMRHYPLSIGYGDGYFTVCTADYARIARSKDGESWEEITSPFDNGAYPVTGDSIFSIASNGYAAPDTTWVATSNNAKLALGKPSINTATDFYVPNKPGYIILY